ncbi:lasso RiPP family leader peptide-containing protein [Nocardia terpenica]|nr:lasso RiPP family leader peptide-containing protein [Nocardia terpenica]NQE87508.1 lasso RiPP family leader peptide-containing protein [Nocardia terpenica]
MENFDNQQADRTYQSPVLVEVGEFKKDTHGAHVTEPEGFMFRAV